jgi:hypothetical protein
MNARPSATSKVSRMNSATACTSLHSRTRPARAEDSSHSHTHSSCGATSSTVTEHIQCDSPRLRACAWQHACIAKQARTAGPEHRRGVAAELRLHRVPLVVLPLEVRVGVLHADRVHRARVRREHAAHAERRVGGEEVQAGVERKLARPPAKPQNYRNCACSCSVTQAAQIWLCKLMPCTRHMEHAHCTRNMH